MTEAEMLDAILLAMEPVAPVDDPGMTITEIARAKYGNSHGETRRRVSRGLEPLLASGKMVRGWRHTIRLDGKRLRVAVFRAT